MQLNDKKFSGSLKANWILALFVLGHFSTASTAIAQTPGIFLPTGDMATGRTNHTATLLPDGRVLIAGGTTDSLSSITATAELYDPITGMFTPTGEMTTGRRSHAAAVLPDGRVLIAGGFGPLGVGSVACPPSLSFGCPLASGELYDPATGTFTRTGDMITSGVAQAILLPNGKVLIAVNRTAQLFVPATGTFSAAGPFADKPFDMSTATLLADGRVLLTGCGGFSCDVGATELYDPGTNTFSRTGAMNEWYSANTATVLVNGKVLFVGTSEDNAPSEAELYDPATGTFAGTGDTIWPHDFATATLVPDGKVLFTGARLPGGAITGGAELYDPDLGTFAYVGSMATFPNKATRLNDGSVLITGRGASRSQISSAELYDPGVPVLWQQAITTMKTAAGSNSLNFWQWAWYWQRSPAFAAAPAGFGVVGSIDNAPGTIDKIIAIGGRGGSQIVSAEQWVQYFRQAAPPFDPWQKAITAMKTTAGGDSLNVWQWAWFWQRSPAFSGAPTGFGVFGSIDNAPGTIDKTIAVGGRDGSQIVSAEQWVQYYRQVTAQ